MDAEICLKDVTPDVMKKIVKAVMGRMSKKPGQPAAPSDEKRADKERNDLADLHEEKKGPVPKQEVQEDDLPFDVEIGEGDEDDEDSASDMEPAPKKKKG